MTQQPTLVLAGGGTGGHVFPLIAVADAVRLQNPDVRLVFVGTARGIEQEVVPARGYELELVRVTPIRGRGFGGGLQGVWHAANSVPEGLRLLQRLKPRALFSIGGYAAGPVSLAARLKGLPVALMEPNSVTGLANRLVAPFVSRAYTSFSEVEKHFPKASVLRTGLALRSGFSPCPYTYSGGSLRVLVLGGSQGAKSLNETVPRALAELPVPVTVIHQAGNGRDAAVRELYRSLGATQVEVVPFISDMQRALRDADLVVGRSGAGATSEVCAVGRPALYIPYPFAAGDHQYENARSLALADAAVVVRAQDASVERLRSEVLRLATDVGLLARLAGRARALGRPDAAAVVARDLLQLAGIRSGE